MLFPTKSEIELLKKLYYLAAEECGQPASFLALCQLIAKTPTLLADNILLLNEQMPTATKVGGCASWKPVSRKVMPGEHPIQLARPWIGIADEYETEEDEDGCVMFDEDNRPIEHLVKVKCFQYRPINVYDISQTKQIGADGGVDEEEKHQLNPLSSEEIFLAFRQITDCQVTTDTNNGTDRAAQYDEEQNCLHLVSSNKTVLAQDCIKELCRQQTNRHCSDVVTAKLIIDTAADILFARYEIGTIVLSPLYKLWLSKHPNENNCLELINQICWVSMQVDSMMRAEINNVLTFSLSEICILNQIVKSSDYNKVVRELETVKRHSDIPILVDIGEGLCQKLKYVQRSGKMQKLFEDRENKRILTQPSYVLYI